MFRNWQGDEWTSVVPTVAFATENREMDGERYWKGAGGLIESNYVKQLKLAIWSFKIAANRVRECSRQRKLFSLLSLLNRHLTKKKWEKY